MKQVIIKKSEWLRGEGDVVSYLKRPEDGKKCCIGFFCEQILNVTSEQIMGKRVLTQIAEVEGLDWIKDEDVYSDNDDLSIDDEERMSCIKSTAAKHGYDFVFVE